MHYIVLNTRQRSKHGKEKKGIKGRERIAHRERNELRKGKKSGIRAKYIMRWGITDDPLKPKKSSV